MVSGIVCNEVGVRSGGSFVIRWLSRKGLQLLKSSLFDGLHDTKKFPACCILLGRSFRILFSLT